MERSLKPFFSPQNKESLFCHFCPHVFPYQALGTIPFSWSPVPFTSPCKPHMPFPLFSLPRLSHPPAQDSIVPGLAAGSPPLPCALCPLPTARLRLPRDLETAFSLAPCTAPNGGGSKEITSSFRMCPHQNSTCNSEMEIFVSFCTFCAFSSLRKVT